jgi:hypothetical protein
MRALAKLFLRVNIDASDGDCLAQVMIILVLVSLNPILSVRINSFDVMRLFMSFFSFLTGPESGLGRGFFSSSCGGGGRGGTSTPFPLLLLCATLFFSGPGAAGRAALCDSRAFCRAIDLAADTSGTDVAAVHRNAHKWFA